MRLAGTLVALVAVLGLGGCKRRTVPAPAQASPGAPAIAPASPPPPPAAAPDGSVPSDYDPASNIQDGADATKVFLAEPRNPAWASSVEAVIGRQLDHDVKHVVPGAGGVSMGCRTLSCLILIDAPADKLPLAIAVVQLVTFGPVTASLGTSPEGRGQLLFVTDRRMADPAAFTSWYRRTRSRTIEAIRSGKQQNPLPIPPSDLPDP
jgi:hypothetical protein